MFQRGQMARDFGLAQSKYIDDLADANLTLPQQIEDTEPGVVSQGFEDHGDFRHRHNPLFAGVRPFDRVFVIIEYFTDQVQCN